MSTCSELSKCFSFLALLFNSYIATRIVAADSVTLSASSPTADIVGPRTLVADDNIEDRYAIRSPQVSCLIP